MGTDHLSTRHGGVLLIFFYLDVVQLNMVVMLVVEIEKFEKDFRVLITFRTSTRKWGFLLVFFYLDVVKVELSWSSKELEDVSCGGMK